MKDLDLKVAASQFPVTADIRRNAKFIKRHIRIAATKKADAILFPEGALPGYGRSKISFKNYDWDMLREYSAEVFETAREHKIWVLLGSAHYVGGRSRPTNCVYAVSPEGKIVDRYDKSMLIGHEHKRYSAGNHPVVIEINGWKCGIAVCFDSHFPELFNRYRLMGAKIVFLAMNGSGVEKITPHIKLLSELIPAQTRTRAMGNRMWIVLANSSTEHSVAPAMVFRPDGIYRAIRPNRPGLICHQFPDEDLGMLYNDKPMKLSDDEPYTNGKVSKAPRAKDRQSLP